MGRGGRNTFTLTHDGTGQSIKAVVIARNEGGKFMKVWQDTGWEGRLGELQGSSLRVLFHLVHVAGWRNEVAGAGETAKVMGMQRTNTARAYRELIQAEFLYKREGAYYLSPFFCWKGNDEQYKEAVEEFGIKKLVEKRKARIGMEIAAHKGRGSYWDSASEGGSG